ncbi:MAG: Holliday junction resolvase RuvX [Gammaproteobacteria bacterium]|nr:Holliday junction resolvase RuvX [Gammaproteobacteria bacterium]MBI5616544.1 Holliday junction resolvase RuvX [Gammaproteobacteria bacterium]
MTALGFDFGEKRIGVAVGQTLTATANPLATLPAEHGQPDWNALARLIAQWQPEKLVVGMPRTADGAPHALKPAVERFARRLHARYRLPVEFVDETLSSHGALQAGPRTGGPGLDARAAALILASWLEHQTVERTH